MLDLVNKTPFAVAMLPSLDKDGAEYLVVVAKATFAVRRDGATRVADEQVPVALADVPYGDPITSSLRYASDGALRKPGVDVVLAGSAFGPTSGVSQLDVELRVGPARKTVRVFGPRVWSRAADRSFRPSRAGRILGAALRWENALGGADTSDADPARHAFAETNPVGRGFVAAGSTLDLEGQLVPELEDPSAPIRTAGEGVAPAGFGFVAPSWAPRRFWAGTYDDAWREERAPLLPLDFDDRHFAAASAGLTLAGLSGGEPISASHVRPGGGSFESSVPRRAMEVVVTAGAASTTTRARLDTLVIETELDRLVLTFRATVPLRRKLLDIDRVKVREVAT